MDYPLLLYVQLIYHTICRHGFLVGNSGVKNDTSKFKYSKSERGMENGLTSLK